MKYSLKISLVFLFLLTIAIPLPANASKKVSYLMDKKKLYTYTHYPNVDTVKFKEKTEYGFDEWVNKKDVPCFAYKETKNGLYGSFREKAISYPIKKGKVWYDKYETNYKYKIVDSKKTLKIKAGTFKNVVVVKEKNIHEKGYSVSYYAPNIGIVLLTRADKFNNYKAERQFELIKLKNK